MFDIETTVARAEIEDLLVRYCRGIDRADIELVKSVYHPGATDNHGIFNGDAAEFAEFVIPMVQATFRCTQHQLSNKLIDITDDSARAETYFVAYHVYQEPETDADRLAILGGRYLDRLERRDGRWGIVDRTVIHDWYDDRETVPYEHVAAFPQGGHGTDDPSAQLFPVGAGCTDTEKGSTT